MKPTIVVRNNPVEEYKTEFGQGLGQRHMMLDYVLLLKKLKSLRLQRPGVVSTIKEARKKEKTAKKQIDQEIFELVVKISKIEKHFDYCALITASLPDVDIVDNNSILKDINNTHGPYVVRAMASKKYIAHAIETGQDYIFLENGYFGNYKNLINHKSKKQWHRVCVNEMQQEDILDVPDDRWKALLQSDDRLRWPGWKKSGSKILLVVPSSKPCEYYNQDVRTWKEQTINTIKQHTDREIVVREKASRSDRTQKKTIYQALDEDIFCMVTYQSIAAVESIAYGIPAFTLAPSAAKSVSFQDLSLIETPYYPDPELVYKWCSSLAYGQFTLEEMLYGDAWRMIMENKTRETISC
ncbi:hypothetical protein UFOVP328_304 [uncultured Caudovirales phage]|uniref:Uncharacterized protein n=1 Tax=uncultured Caudovirales phage TaxID=2100421 RepID=A0A6J5LVG7_9CAUD|nr:hypothetical protein UFOVP328_304 [uncultured Caudovirales phage]